MKIIEKPISLKKIQAMAKAGFGNLVKAVVDVEKEILALDGEFHADEEALLLENGSLQKNLWGINFYPDKTGNDFLEFDSMINLRPAYGNNSRGVDSREIRQKIISIVGKLISK